MKKIFLLISTIIVVIIGGIAAYTINKNANVNENSNASDDIIIEENSNVNRMVNAGDGTEKNQDTPSAGTYITYSAAAYESAKQYTRVLYFHATWCPDCRVINAEFESDSDKIPANVTVLKTDYDTETELKKKYGVTYQHTFVQVDANGDAITKWNGGGIDELIKRIQQ